eukprot:TRINITY_DN2946_c0_g1_i1.p1 TRINITY_DN2946_c0_g1~~TRINITY_DN2946_c0_g1_i1.p1  ORF type:complete len:614 (+),score=194.88 TRINITY_DN2946_c0_g1_i1:69-1910(+)
MPFNVFPAKTLQRPPGASAKQGAPPRGGMDGDDEGHTDSALRPSPPTARKESMGQRHGGERGGADSSTAAQKKKQVDLLKKRMTDIRSTIDVARGVAGSVVVEGENMEQRMEKVAKLLDAVQGKFKGLDRLVKDCVDYAYIGPGAAGGKKALYSGGGGGVSMNHASSPVAPGIGAAAAAPSPGPGNPLSLAASLNALASSGPLGARSGGATIREENMPSKIVTSLYFVLESLAHATQAEKGMVLLYNGKTGDELQAVASVGPRPPSTRSGAYRTPVNAGGVLGSVFMSGIAVNQIPSTEARKEEQALSALEAMASAVGVSPPAQERKSLSRAEPGGKKGATTRGGMLCFPIQNLHTSEVVGVVQLSNKRQRVEPFTPDDEQICYAATKLLSFLVKRYPVDFFAAAPFNPASLHSVTPADAPPILKNMPVSIQLHDSRQLVYRTSQSGQYIRQKLSGENAASGANVGAVSTSASLIEVDGYIQNLEECWKRSVGLNIDYEREHDTKLGVIRRMREETKKDRTAIGSLQDALQMRSAEFDGYREQYEGLKHDLHVLRDVKHGRAPLESIHQIAEAKGLGLTDILSDVSAARPSSHTGPRVNYSSSGANGGAGIDP